MLRDNFVGKVVYYFYNRRELFVFCTMVRGNQDAESLYYTTV